MSQQINLFNPIFLRQKKYFSAIAAVQAVGLLLLGMLAFYAFAVFEVDGLTRQASALERGQRAAQERLTRVTAEFGAKPADPAIGAAVKRLQAELDARRGVLVALESGGFGSDRGLAEYMRALSRRVVHGLWLTGFSIEEGGENYRISGLALSAELVPAFVRGLGVEKTMRGRTLDNMTLSTQAFAFTPARATQALQVPVIAFVLSSGMAAEAESAPEAAAAPSTPVSPVPPATVTPAASKAGN